MLAFRPLVFAKAGPDPRPQQKKLRVKDVERTIQHAKLICFGHEDTAACRVAWDRVEEISSAFARQREAELAEEAAAAQCEDDPEACKEYDV
jgi:hypothetical protein